LAYEQPSLIILVEPPPVLNSMLLDEPPTVWPLSVRARSDEAGVRELVD
jgi:hypothetical protein